MAAADPFLLSGTTIEGKYRVEKVIGDGGFGVVYRGVHAGFDEPIAVKCLKLPRALDDDQRRGFLEQLREEGRLLHRLSKATPGIVQALDVGAVTTEEGVWVPFLILEWLEGETLAEHLAKRIARRAGPFEVADAVRLLEPAMRALAVAHAMKVAHRDVKPENLFVTTALGVTTLKVLDFGIAKVVTDYPTFREALAATQARPSAFTPRYGAPEQFNKARGPSGPWTDVFALGLIFLELITGEKALLGDDPTQLYIASADPTERPTARAHGVVVSDALEAVVAKALAVDPTARYADAGALLEALSTASGVAPSSPIPASGSGVRRSAALASEARTVSESAKLSGEEATEVAPSTAVAATRVVAPSPPGATIATGAREPRTRAAHADPMSETPFFERHQLPPSRTAAGLDPPLEAARERTAAPPVRRRTAIVAGAIALIAATGAAAFFLDLGGVRGGPRSSSSGIVLTTPVLPSARAVSSSGPRSNASKSPRPAPLVSASSASSAAPTTINAPPPPDMVLVAPASFRMSEGENAHDATVARGFYLDKTEVTARAYQACVTKHMCSSADRVSLVPGTPVRFAPAEDDGGQGEVAAYVESWSRRCTGPQGADDHPINCVDFASAEAFCRWAGKRLPTEAEWELAARGPGGRAFAWGDAEPSCDRSCYDRNGGCRAPAASVSTCAVGAFPGDRTPEGISDLGAGVAEWTSDTGTPGARGALRVVRGGSFIDGAEALRASVRAEVPPALAHAAVGFRCALDGPVR